MTSNPTGGRVLILGTALVLVLAACGGSATAAPATPATPAATPAAATAAAPATPAATPATASEMPAETPAATQAPAETPAETAAAGSQAPVSDPIAALADLTSYKLKLAITSQGVTGGMGAFGDITMEGTIILKPTPAADVQLGMGATKIHAVEVNGKQYVDMGGTGLIESTSSSSMVDGFKPETLFGSVASYASQMTVVGDENKNGVATTHLTAPASLLASAAAPLGSAFGLTDGTWTMDVWIAKDGGYAVSYVIAGKGASSSLSMSMDLSNVNDPANVVKGP